jgi:ketosteroid isomerase-like protein
MVTRTLGRLSILGSAVMLALSVLLCGPARADDQAQIAAAFTRFIEAANAHDLDAVGAIILESPEVVWYVNHTDAQGHEGVMRYFERVFDGRWSAKPDLSRAKWTRMGPGSWKLVLPIVIAEGSSDGPAQPLDFEVSQAWLLTAEGWKLLGFVTRSEPAP